MTFISGATMRGMIPNWISTNKDCYLCYTEPSGVMLSGNEAYLLLRWAEALPLCHPNKSSIINDYTAGLLSLPLDMTNRSSPVADVLDLHSHGYSDKVMKQLRLHHI